MSIAQGLLPGWLLVLAAILYALLLLLALVRAPWGALGREPRLQHIWLGATVALMLMWLLRAGISPGMSIHFSGATVLALLFGWELAVLATALALVGTTLIGLEAWEGFGINALLAGALPVLWSYGFLRFIERLLPANFFIYLFLGVFLNAALAVAVSGSAMMGLLWLADAYPGSKLVAEYLVLLPLIMFPEGLMNGIIMTGLMVFYPDWIRTFDARRYIDDQ